MTRQHLYKAQRTDNGERVIGSLVVSGCRAWIKGDGDNIANPRQMDTGNKTADWRCVEVDPATVCEATGLLDKNGRMIFEGDVVHCVSRTDAGEMVVIFEEGEFRMVLCENYANYSTGMGFYAIRCFSKEILSNIHDKEVRDE